MTSGELIGPVLVVTLGTATLTWWLVELPMQRFKSVGRGVGTSGVGAALRLCPKGATAMSRSVADARCP